MSSVSRSGLSPVAALCLRVVKGWLGVVSRGKGGELRNGVPYTRLKATEVQQQLEAEQGVAVSSKTVQRALTELVVGGHLSRRQLYKHRYNRTYWYAPGELEQQLEQHRPSVVAKQHRATRSSQQPQKGCNEGSPVSLHVLPSQLTYSAQKEASRQTTKQPQTEEVSKGQTGGLQEVVSKAWGKLRPTAQTPRTGAHSGRLQQAQQRLVEVVQRAATYRGFNKTEQSSPAKPSSYVLLKAESAQSAGFLC